MITVLPPEILQYMCFGLGVLDFFDVMRLCLASSIMYAKIMDDEFCRKLHARLISLRMAARNGMWLVFERKLEGQKFSFKDLDDLVTFITDQPILNTPRVVEPLAMLVHRILAIEADWMMTRDECERLKKREHWHFLEAIYLAVCERGKRRIMNTLDLRSYNVPYRLARHAIPLLDMLEFSVSLSRRRWGVARAAFEALVGDLDARWKMLTKIIDFISKNSSMRVREMQEKSAIPINVTVTDKPTRHSILFSLIGSGCTAELNIFIKLPGFKLVKCGDMTALDFAAKRSSLDVFHLLSPLFDEEAHRRAVISARVAGRRQNAARIEELISQKE
jgi:hypothetical protein